MKKLILLSIFSILGLSLETFSQGDLLVTPSRVVFDNRKLKQEISIVNKGKDSATYSISFVQKHMLEDGSFFNIDNPKEGQMYSDPYLRIFPRTVTLSPGEPQVIMVQYTRKSDMLAGEYRSHLYFRAEKSNKPLGLEDIASNSKEISVMLSPVYGMSIPIIIRSGDVKVSSTISNMKMEVGKDKKEYIDFTINRVGNISLYGDIRVEFKPNNGKAFEVGNLNSVGVYTDIDKRNINLKLDNNSGKLLTKGKLKVQYFNNSEAKQVLYSESIINVK